METEHYKEVAVGAEIAQPQNPLQLVAVRQPVPFTTWKLRVTCEASRI